MIVGNKIQQQTVTLGEVGLVSSLHISTISMRRLRHKGVMWDQEKDYLIHNGEIFCLLEDHYDQWVIEYNIPTQDATFAATHANFISHSAVPRPISAGDADKWHQRLGHIHPDAIQHLLSNVQGARLTNSPTTIECETCSLTKAHEEISWQLRERATTPFEQVHFDLMQLTEAYNGHR